MYHSRKLPHIIGTQSFLADEFVGLENLSETEDLEDDKVSESSDESEEELDFEEPMQNPDSVQAEKAKSIPNPNVCPDDPDADSEYSDDDDVEESPKLTNQKAFNDKSDNEDQDTKSFDDPDNFEELEKPVKNDFLSELSSKIQVGGGSPKVAESSPELVQNSPKLTKSSSPKMAKMAKNKVTKDPKLQSKNDTKPAAKVIQKPAGKVIQKPAAKMIQKPGKSLFESDSDSDDLFSGKKSEKPAVQKPLLSDQKKSLFDDLSDEEGENPVLPVPEKPTVQVQKADKFFFEDSSSDDLEDLFVKKIEKKAEIEKPGKFSGSSVKDVIAANIKRSKVFDSSPESESDESNGELKEEEDKPVLKPDDETDGFLADKAKKLTTLVTSKIGNPKKNQRQSLNPDDYVEVPKPDFSITEINKPEKSGSSEPPLAFAVEEKFENSENSALSEPPLAFAVEEKFENPILTKNSVSNENPILLSSVTKNRANLGNRKRRPPTRQKLKTTTDPDEIFKDTSQFVDNPDSSDLPSKNAENIESDEKQEIIVKKSTIPKQGNALLINELRVKLKPSQKPDNAQEITEPTVSKNPGESENLIENVSSETGFRPNSGKLEMDDPAKSKLSKPSNYEISGTSDQIVIESGFSDPIVTKPGFEPNSGQSKEEETSRSKLSNPSNNVLSGTSDKIEIESGLSGLASKSDSKNRKPVMLEDSDSDSESLFNPPPIPDQIKKKSENLFAGFSSSDDDDDLFSTTTKSSKKPEHQTKKSGGLFDDDSDSDLDDLFSGKK